MSVTTQKTTIILAASVALTAGANLATADTANPFAVTELSSGYMQVAEGKCGEGKCGGEKKAEGKCGADKKAEDKCGEGKCGGEKKAEGKCGEGKCGSNK